jgi:hypothetical protein
MVKNFTNQNFSKTLRMARICFFSMLVVLAFGCKKDSTVDKTLAASTFQFVYISDAHFGITRATFQGASNVNATVVNAKMVEKN